MRKNIVTATDSYKFGHWDMMPKGTENVYSYFEARTGALYNKVVFFGLQYYLKEYLQGKVVTLEDIDYAEKLSLAHFGNAAIFNRDMWLHILIKHGGKLPVRIKAVPEGTPVSVNNVLMTVEVTDPKCYQLTNHLETMLSQIWYPCTVATLSYEVKKLMAYYLNETVGNTGLLPFQLHDFGNRGATTQEAAGIGGAAHLINFMGTDTVIAMNTAIEYYKAGLEGLAYSVPATEHSVMTAMGKDGEEALFGKLLDTYPAGILSVVIDSYDYKNFINMAGTKYKDKIMARQGKVVFRPDSGDPTATTMDVLELLGKHFGVNPNDKGYKKLPDQVGMLWGDGIDYQGIRSILFTMRNNGWAADNIVFGMGGGLLQKLNRDTMRFAFKSSAQMRNGIWYDIQKNPLDASKKSKAGRLALIKNQDGEWHTVKEDAMSGMFDHLKLVFENGEIVKEYTFDEIRNNAKEGI